VRRPACTSRVGPGTGFSKGWPASSVGNPGFVAGSSAPVHRLAWLSAEWCCSLPSGGAALVGCASVCSAPDLLSLGSRWP